MTGAGPTFILGCGRSGTTILGTALSYHPEITYLNEPRHLWFSCYPETDIWTNLATSRSGKLALTKADADAAKSQMLRHLFHLETLKTGRPVLVEKLPINNFRLSFIREIFPDARFVHILRNGIEVARSIEKETGRTWYGRKKKWFGKNDYKWNLLAQYASTKSDVRHLPKICINDYERGLLEWRLSTQAVYDFFRNIPRESYSEITYDDFVDAPDVAINRVLSFLGLEKNQEVENFVRRQVTRKSTKINLEALSAKEIDIGGEILRDLMLKKEANSSPIMPALL